MYSYWIKVQPILNEPPGLTPSARSILVIWSSQHEGDGPVEKYTVYWKTVTTDFQSIIVGPDKNTYTLRDLKPNGQYEFAISASRAGQGGEGPKSPTATVKTNCTGNHSSNSSNYVHL